MSKMLSSKCRKYVGLLELTGRYFTVLFSILKIFSLKIFTLPEVHPCLKCSMPSAGNMLDYWN